MAINGTAVAITGVGAMFLYAGISNKSALSVLQNIIVGKNPSTATANTADSTAAAAFITNPNSGTIQNAAFATTGSFSGGSAQAAMQQAAAVYGWNTGAEWTALVAIENQEAGFDPTNTNPTSHAYGLAQSLGHPFSGGPASNGINEYGGNGLTPAQSQAASLGDPYYQSVWMMNYIKSRYGDPITAEQFHLANNWY